VLGLLRNPDQLALLRADRSLLTNAVEEFLRIDGPINMATFRYTAEEVELDGVVIPEGELVLVSLLSAPRPGEVPGAGEAGHHPDDRRARRVRARHPLLPRRPAGEARRRDRHRVAARPVRPRTRGRTGESVEVEGQHAAARAGAVPG
jgi:hypothetical protein